MSDLDLSAIDSVLLRASEKKSRIATASAMKRFLDPTLFFTGRSFDSWRETLDFMCGSMERNGIVPDAFRESVSEGRVLIHGLLPDVRSATRNGFSGV